MPRKAVSRKQYRWFKAVESGDVKAPGLSPERAKEMTAGQTSAGLSERVRKASAKRRKWRFV